MDLDPGFHSIADPDPASKNKADPDPQPCSAKYASAILKICTVFNALPWLTLQCIVGRVEDVSLFFLAYVIEATDPDPFKKQ